MSALAPEVLSDAGRTALQLVCRALGGSPSVAPETSALRVGVDIVEVSEVSRSVARFGDRYVQRIFTPHEIACCRIEPVPAGAGGAGGYAYESLAARFAAKEATVKVLRPEGPRPEWRTIEVHRADSGWCELRLTGLAALLAERSGIDRFAVSLTHEAAFGVAVVVATGACGPTTVGPIPYRQVANEPIIWKGATDRQATDRDRAHRDSADRDRRE